MQKVMYFLCDLVSHIVGIDIPDSSLVIGCATLSHIMQIYGENKIYEFTNFFLRKLNAYIIRNGRDYSHLESTSSHV